MATSDRQEQEDEHVEKVVGISELSEPQSIVPNSDLILRKILYLK